MKKYKFVCALSFEDAMLQILLWVILCVVTIGVAIPFFAYFFLRLIINRTELHEIV